MTAASLGPVELFGGSPGVQCAHGRTVVVHRTTRYVVVPILYRCGCIGKDVYERQGDIGLFMYHEFPMPHIRDAVMADPAEAWKDPDA